MEGPSLLILREELAPFVGKKVRAVSGNTQQPKESLKGLYLSEVRTWGKNLFLLFTKARAKSGETPQTVKVHFLMWGSYRINEVREGRQVRLSLEFPNGVFNIYAASVRLDAQSYLESLDSRVDLMSPRWNLSHVLKLLSKKKSGVLCDLFLDQQIFAGSGNIIKNEVLFNLRRHPLTRLSQIDEKDWPVLARAVREYCWNFYKWKKKFELRKHWQVYRQARCPLCGLKLHRENLGKNKRRTHYCPHCQPLPKVRAKVKLKAHRVLPIREKGAAPRREARVEH
jgi:endonuclease-8